jgi:MFS transporter, DHA3 family, macrolide efflux protein
MNQSKKSFTLFLVIWIVQLLSKIGSGLSAFALGVYLFQKTGSTAAYSFLLLCAFLPSVLLAPVGGVIADRKDRKLLMVIGDCGAALGILLVILMLLLTPDTRWPIYLGVALSSVFTALHSPAFKAAVTDLLNEQAYAKASGLIQLAEASRHLLAPVIAGFLLTWFNLPLVLAIDVLTFIVAALTVFLLRKTVMSPKVAVPHTSFWQDFTEGVRYIAKSAMIFQLLCLTTIVTFLVGILQSLFAPLILSFTTATTLGTVQSIAASGMLVSSLLIGLFSKTANQRKIISYSLFAAGLFYLLIGIRANTVVITTAAFGFFCTLPFVNTSLEVLFRQNIANEVQGRVWSLISLISQGGMLVAFGMVGVLADRVFNPLLTDNGRLAATIGKIIGTGAARGCGLMVIISGCLLALYALVMTKQDRGAEKIVAAP